MLRVAIIFSLLLTLAPAALAQREVQGEWGKLRTDWPNVPIHVHLLPDCRVLFWGRRDHPTDSLDAQECTPHIWDPVTNKFTDVAQPLDKNGAKVNLFCSGHTFLSDGRLLVVGGHHADNQGIDQATIFDPATALWTPIDPMTPPNSPVNFGRWYPTAVTLADGRVVVTSGSRLDGTLNPFQQVEENGHWRNIVDFQGLPLYPRLHLAPNGNVFMSGLINERLQDNHYQGTFLLDVAANGGFGQWTRLNAPHLGPLRDYYPSVLYDVGKILVVGGGSPPLKTAEKIDLTAATPAWVQTDDMHFPRRHHNATVLPDGTVLVTGGTQGPSTADAKRTDVDSFNDLRKGMPVHTAELWDPSTGHWTLMAVEQADRCYHSTAILLPDATVLSAGGGEFRPNIPTVLPDNENLPADSHRDAQVFSPPYLFRGGDRPDITSAPAEVTYGQTFDVGTTHPGKVGRTSWIRLSSVTHAFNVTQRFLSLTFASDGNKLHVTAPPTANVSPPGFYMLFVLDKRNVPSIAKIMRIH